MVDLLVLVRHGKAEPKGPEGDLARELAPDGVAALEEAYPRIFATLEPVGELELWSSPAARAERTAEVAADALGVDPMDIVSHDCLYEQDEDGFLSELSCVDGPTVVAVGHVPFMRNMVERLCGEDVPFGKGTVAAIDFPTGRLAAGQARLLWLREA